MSEEKKSFGFKVGYLLGSIIDIVTLLAGEILYGIGVGYGLCIGYKLFIKYHGGF